MTSGLWADALRQDLRHAGRTLRRAPGFAAAVVLTMSVGIGANVAILGLVHAALIKPLPFAQPDQIYSVEIVVPERREQIPSLPASVQTYFRWRSEPSPFAALAAVRPWEASLSGDGDPERVGGARISANFFSLLGVAMAHGRDFAPGEEQPGRERVVVISDALWRRR